MSDPINSAIGIVRVLKNAYDLYNACVQAGGDFRTVSKHVQGMTIVLEGVNSDLVKNPRSVINRGGDIAKNKSTRLKTLVVSCEVSLTKVKALLAKYHNFQHNRPSAWDSFKWGTSGKAEIANIQADLILSILLLNAFMAKEGLDVLSRVEQAIELLIEKFDRLGSPEPNGPTDARRQMSSGVHVGRCLIASFFISRLMARVRSKKAPLRKNSMTGNKRAEKIKPVIRVRSGLNKNKRRDTLLSSYVTKIASPDVNKPGFGSSSPLQSTNNRFLQTLSNKGNPMGEERLECWRIAKAKYAVGGFPVIDWLLLKRGQRQLREMVCIFEEASENTKRALDPTDTRIRLILKSKRKAEKDPSYEWGFATGRTVHRDHSKSGMILYEQIIVILKRRKIR
ncbi:hypothetical protein AOQ84DRAFT_225027 [Glonium stellatum]|uniref:Uncharacterized protein n=1 Tax=Glonium stellatum TaxID=574774 RepID=A0A8E2EUQ2_9PEZI|nr:hypothetical protein AOQ84DRAFT_225027 [Glonium stellatum]